MNCKHAAWLMSLRQDRPLKLGENLGLRLHLSYCPGCRAYRQQLDFLQRACRAFTPPESTPPESTPPESIEAPPADSDTPPSR